MKKPTFILASKSPRRSELLQNLGVEFDVAVSDIDESKIPRNLPPKLYVQELALLKGTSIGAGCGEGRLVIAADTVVVCDGEIIGKPADEAEARRMLQMMSGKAHEVYTGFSITDSTSGMTASGYEVTKVRFRKLSDEEIDAYIASGAPYDKAGGYGIQGRASLFVEGIDGDYFNVVGLPLNALNELMKKEFNISL